MSTGLLNAVYCNVFGLRTRDEHCSLCVEKYHFGSDDNGDYSVFSGRSSKLYHGGLKYCKLKAQELPKYRIPCSLCVEKYHFGSDDNVDYSVFSGRSSKL